MGLLCLSCGLASDERAELIATVFAAVALFASLALGVAFLSDRTLIRFVAAIMTCQQLVVVAKMAAPQIGNVLFAQISNAAGITNFDVQFVKPGCSVPQIDFIMLVWITLSFISSAVVAFVLAAMMRAFVSSMTLHEWRSKCGFACAGREDVSPTRVIEEEKEPFCMRFKRRAIHSLVILGNIVYLQITTRVIQGLDCVVLPDGSRLQVDLDVPCYSGRHSQLVGVLWVLLFLYCIGFPAFCLHTLIYRIKGHTKEKKFKDFLSQYGYLFRDVKERFIWFRWTSFCTNFVLAVQSVLNTSTLTRVFSSAFIFTVEFCLVVLLNPFETKFNAFIQAFSGLANSVQVLFFLAFLNDPSPLRNKLFVADTTFVSLAVVLVIACRICRGYTRPAAANAADGGVALQPINRTPTTTAQGTGQQRVSQSGGFMPDRNRPLQLVLEDLKEEGEREVKTPVPMRSFSLDVGSPAARIPSSPQRPTSGTPVHRDAPLLSPARSGGSADSGSGGDIELLSRKQTERERERDRERETMRKE